MYSTIEDTDMSEIYTTMYNGENYYDNHVIDVIDGSELFNKFFKGKSKTAIERIIFDYDSFKLVYIKSNLELKEFVRYILCMFTHMFNKRAIGIVNEHVMKLMAEEQFRKVDPINENQINARNNISRMAS